MFKTTIVLSSILLSVSLVSAQTIERPNVKPGDTWTYQSTTELTANQAKQTPAQFIESHYEVTVIRTGSTGILIARKQRGSKLPAMEMLLGSDWSRSRSINGEETVVNRPLQFPLKPGKSWEMKFTENNPNSEFKSYETKLTYTVIGWEEVSVPAGKFKALKIEVDGRWKNEREPSTDTFRGTRTSQGGTTNLTQSRKSGPTTFSGKLYRIYWYVPEAKTYVKSIEESFFTSGTLSRRITDQVESFKVSP